MPTHLVAFDLDDGSGSHDRVRRYLTSFDHSIELGDVHLVATDRDVTQVRDAARSRLAPTESVVVLEVSGRPWATGGAPTPVSTWLRQHVADRTTSTRRGPDLGQAP